MPGLLVLVPVKPVFPGEYFKMKKGKPQITQITQIFLFLLRAPSCNFVANFLVIFMVAGIRI